MHKIERVVYDFVKGNPRLKLLIRNIYQTLFDIIPDKNNFHVNDILCKEGYFFGFHDCTPFSLDDRFILANKLNTPLRMPLDKDILSVGYWDSNFTKYTIIGESLAWNYHKGCRLQWLDSDNKIAIYNTCRDSKLKSVVYDVVNGSEELIDFPIDSTSVDGNYATSFSFCRVNSLMPGYGYDIEDDSCIENNTPSTTGLFIVDILKNKKRLLMDLKSLSEILPNSTMIDARHFVTHSHFSPDGKYVAFLHRWVHHDVTKRFSRLIISSLDGKDNFISPTSGMVSHYVWDDFNGLIVYCQVDGVDGHYLFSDHQLKNPRLISSVELNSDGHQHFIPKTHKFVTDTYPDRRRYTKIYVVDMQEENVEMLCNLKSFRKYQSPNAYKHWACDLHPRVNNKGDMLCFDSVHTGNRSICFMKFT